MLSKFIVAYNVLVAETSLDCVSAMVIGLRRERRFALEMNCDCTIMMDTSLRFKWREKKSIETSSNEATSLSFINLVKFPLKFTDIDSITVSLNVGIIILDGALVGKFDGNELCKLEGKVLGVGVGATEAKMAKRLNIGVALGNFEEIIIGDMEGICDGTSENNGVGTVDDLTDGIIL